MLSLVRPSSTTTTSLLRIFSRPTIPRTSPAAAVRITINMAAQKRSFNEGKRHFKKSKKLKTGAGAPAGITATEGSNEEVLLHDVRSLLRELQLGKTEGGAGGDGVAAAAAAPATPATDALGAVESQLPELQSEIDVEISRLSSTGDGLGAKDGRVYVVPFTAPGDVVKARVYRHANILVEEASAQNDAEEEQKGEKKQDEGSGSGAAAPIVQGYSLADYVSLVTPSPQRAPEPPPCRYFASCSGCQFQHLPYATQLAHKRTVVERAYANFSGLPASAVPTVGETIGSPLQYGYRTKLTPHFDGPPNGRRDRRHGVKANWPGVPDIGFMLKGTRKTMDIEDCIIGTEVVRRGMRRERKRVEKEIDTYQRGATLLLRESTSRAPKDVLSKSATSTAKDGETPSDNDPVIEDRGEHIDTKICITDHKQTSTEYIDGFRLDNPAGAFFQNNNSILPLVTQYIRDNILGPKSEDSAQAPIKNMIDAYCGSGFFTITLSQMFTRSIGIDVSGQSIDFASRNATLNSLALDSTKFLAADANALFASVDTTQFPPAETAVILDPPRKGCDRDFIRQLLKYGPARICYVSCNVHTQARDVGWLVGGLQEEGEEPAVQGGLYEIESVRGFDFFPQTSHVEGVAILARTGEKAV